MPSYTKDPYEEGKEEGGEGKWSDIEKHRIVVLSLLFIVVSVPRAALLTLGIMLLWWVWQNTGSRLDT